MKCKVVFRLGDWKLFFGCCGNDVWILVLEMDILIIFFYKVDIENEIFLFNIIKDLEELEEIFR